MPRVLRVLPPTPVGRVALGAVLVLLVVALLPVDAVTNDLANRLAPPSPAHPLGTDHLGRDLLARIAAGTRLSVGFTLLAVTVCALVGTIAGMLAGYLGGPGATLLLRIVDVLVAVPAVILGLVLAAVLQPGLRTLLLAVVVTGWTPFARLAYQLTLREAGSGHVESAIALGAGPGRVVFGHILRAVVRPLLAHGCLRFANTLLAIAGLSFLGLGAQPPTPEWGAMLAEGRQYLFSAPGLVLAPAVAVLAVALLVTLLGRALERRWTG
ncbi:ABC transporter permease [Pseudonocardia sp. H11422]|uniref:ABC transporter permease n=1 Tax=Pseudonocardia sp. H11422 TaxID=2835866 RepID=UPI0020289C88|nr:ABC transporter permease [Pseudonocardia sp. H11422]